MKIYIAEDDRLIAGAIKKHFEVWGFEVKAASDFTDIMGEFLEFKPDLVLMDIGLPFYNGYYWCSQIRKISKLPIIFISSASDNMNIVMAVNMGADDFIAKPFDLEVLNAKVQAILRRCYDFSVSGRVFSHGGAVLSTDDGSVSYEGKKLELTKNEYKIMQVLMENNGKIVSRDILMQKLWESDSFVDENTLSVNIARLRKKLEGIGLCGFISTKKGQGYIIE